MSLQERGLWKRSGKEMSKLAQGELTKAPSARGGTRDEEKGAEGKKH